MLTQEFQQFTKHDNTLSEDSLWKSNHVVYYFVLKSFVKVLKSALCLLFGSCTPRFVMAHIVFCLFTLFVILSFSESLTKIDSWKNFKFWS